jgi:chloramphenicol 3-O-phosphotransferase/GNAT superfamily N-acetyltransferase
MPEKINDWTGKEAPIGYSWKEGRDLSGNIIYELQAGPFAQKIPKTFQEVVLTLAKIGHSIVIDDVSFGKEQLDEWKKLLKDFQVCWVGVNAPLSILEEREKQRGNRMIGSARWQFHTVHLDSIYDIEIDTHRESISQNIEKIKETILNYRVETIIRPIQEEDISKIVAEYSFPWSTPEKTKMRWQGYYKEQQEGRRIVAIVEKENEIFGYGSLVWHSKYLSFSSKNIPEIHDVWIGENYRRQGFAKALIKWMENLAKEEGYHEIGIGVGLYRDYGAAQRLYFQLGYVPDGNGISYKEETAVPGKNYPLDDDLLLWLKKFL